MIEINTEIVIEKESVIAIKIKEIRLISRESTESLRDLKLRVLRIRFLSVVLTIS